MKKCLLAALCLALLLLCGCSQYSGKYDDGIKAFSNGDFAEAAAIFSACDPSYGNAATYASYSQGMVFFQQGQYAAAEPYFESTQGFMYASQRYQYCHGCVLCEQGDFTGAAEAFTKVGEFEDAPQWLQYAQAREAEQNNQYQEALYGYEAAGEVSDAPDRLLNLQTQIYSHAIELMQSGDYDRALILFSYLGDYLSSQDYAQQCREVDRDSLYDQAETYVSQGELAQAWRLFTSLGSYRDAAARAEELAEALGFGDTEEE